jgi:hypothetical protein
VFPSGARIPAKVSLNTGFNLSVTKMNSDHYKSIKGSLKLLICAYEQLLSSHWSAESDAALFDRLDKSAK